MNENEIIRNRWIELSRNHSGWSISVSSRGEESPAGLVLRGFGFFLWLRIPPLIPPYREKVTAQSWDAATVARMGRDWYWTAPSRVFAFKDFDGEEINCTTRIEEREWLRGDKWCKWLSRFYAPKVSRSLDLEFSKETGRRKGSWKGGTIGHSIEMLPGELHESAFRRYCAQNNMTFIGEVGRD